MYDTETAETGLSALSGIAAKGLAAANRGLRHQMWEQRDATQYGGHGLLLLGCICIRKLSQRAVYANWSVVATMAIECARSDPKQIGLLIVENNWAAICWSELLRSARPQATSNPSAFWKAAAAPWKDAGVGPRTPRQSGDFRYSTDDEPPTPFPQRCDLLVNVRPV